MSVLKHAALIARRVAYGSWPRAGTDAARRLWCDRRGQIALIFGLASVTVLMAVGAGVDLGRAYLARQQLSNVATLACQYANRPSVLKANFGLGPVGGGSGSDVYRASVNAFAAASLAAQHIAWTQTVATPFTFVPGGVGTVSLNATVPTAFMGIVGVAAMPVAATAPCGVIGAPQPPTADASDPTPIVESFENVVCPPGAGCISYISPNGVLGSGSVTPQSTTSTSYVGTTNTAWRTIGYCLEIDSVGIIRSTVPDGTHSAELDCDNTKHSGGNSSISTKAYLQTGSYELRWNYASRIEYPTYDPVHICGSAAIDTAWANDSVPTYLTRTNQINVYLDADTAGSPPLHTTLDGSQQLAGANLIDTCVYAPHWIERSVAISVTTAGYYWLSFAADGHNDSFGGQIDYIRLCARTCAGSVVPDNFPPSWLAANNGGSNKQLFRDGFESPAFNPGGGVSWATATLDASYGTTGTPSSGWPNGPAAGWIMTPYDFTEIYLSGSAQGTQSVELDATATQQAPNSNRSIHRLFLLDPGYYELDYDYVSNVIFQGVGGSVYCNAAPTNISFYTITGGTTSNDRLGGGSYYANYDTNIEAAFMSNAQLVSAPSSSAASPAASYLNPDGTTTTTAKVPPDGLNLATYNGSQVNPVLDICGFAAAWQNRSTVIRINKTGQYWLTFAGLGTADNRGAVIDDVRLTALGSLAMSAPPSNAVAIPVPDPQPGTTISYAGFSIVAEHTP